MLLLQGGILLQLVPDHFIFGWPKFRSTLVLAHVGEPHGEFQTKYFTRLSNQWTDSGSYSQYWRIGRGRRGGGGGARGEWRKRERRWHSKTKEAEEELMDSTSSQTYHCFPSFIHLLSWNRAVTVLVLYHRLYNRKYDCTRCAGARVSNHVMKAVGCVPRPDYTLIWERGCKASDHFYLYVRCLSWKIEVRSCDEITETDQGKMAFFVHTASSPCFLLVLLYVVSFCMLCVGQNGACFNGERVGGRCQCNRGWTGVNCEHCDGRVR